MTVDLLKFGTVMLVVMLGFVMSFHALAHRSNTFGETWLDVFKAMLSEVDLFDDFSGGPYDTTATVLLVMYLLVMTVMLLNLLIAVLSTLHGQAADNAEREYKVAKARLIDYYRLVVREDLLPVPFNLIQLAASLPFVFCKHDEPGQMGLYRRSRRMVGYASFSLTLGPCAIIFGTFFWLCSAFFSPFVLYTHLYGNDRGSKTSGNVFSSYAISMCRVLVAPTWLVYWWLRGLLKWCTGFRSPVPRAESEPMQGSKDLRRHGPRVKRKISNVNTLLRAAPGSLEAEKLREYLNNPISDPEVREDEKKKNATVEHLKLLRNRIDSGLYSQRKNVDGWMNRLHVQQIKSMQALLEVLDIVKTASESNR